MKPQFSPFDYLLNAFEQASQASDPATHGYGEKRRALLEYVEKLEASVPEEATPGWKLVPVIPTATMLEAARTARPYREDDGDPAIMDSNSESTWAAMTAYAPSMNNSEVSK